MTSTRWQHLYREVDLKRAPAVKEFQDYRELLDDSMVRLLMAVDDVDVDHLIRVLARVASALRNARAAEGCDYAASEDVRSELRLPLRQ
jgi:hypothetical protein